MRHKQYVYIFDCVSCYGFYGEQVLTQEGKLLCPECLGEQDKDSPYVEKMRVHREVGFFDPSEVERKWA